MFFEFLPLVLFEKIHHKMITLAFKFALIRVKFDGISLIVVQKT